MRDKYKNMAIVKPADYKAVSAAISEVKTKRVEVEKTRKVFKADALEYGRKVDAEAKRVTALLLEIEEPLKATKQAVDDEKAREAEEKRLAEENRVNVIKRWIENISDLTLNLNDLDIDALTKHIENLDSICVTEEDCQEFTEEADTAKQTAYDALTARLAEKIKSKEQAELLRIAQEKLDRMKAEQDRIEREAQEKLDEERRLKEEAERQLREQQEEIKRKEDEAALKIKLEKEAKEKAEREHAEKLDREAKEKAEKEEAEQREAALRPDKEKLLAWSNGAISKAISEAPTLSDNDMTRLLDNALSSLSDIQAMVEKFTR
jgi:hypothetical protein